MGRKIPIPGLRMLNEIYLRGAARIIASATQSYAVSLRRMDESLERSMRAAECSAFTERLYNEIRSMRE